VSRYQKGKTNLDFTEARDSEWQWHQLGHMQVCTSLQTDNHASTPPLCFLQAGCPSCRPTNSVKALKAPLTDLIMRRHNSLFGHVARLGDDTVAHQTLHARSTSLLDVFLHGIVTRVSCCRSQWLSQICSDNNLPSAADLWRYAVRRGHSALMQRSQLTI